MLLGRRGAMLALGAALSGCGFRPVYMPHDDAAGGAQDQLASVRIAQIGERSGQLLRQELQARMNQSSGVAKKFELLVNFTISTDAVSIQSDSTASRLRSIGSALWTLKTIGLEPKVLATGNARVIDGLNILNQQYFEADLAGETVTRRIATNLADSITLQLAAYFARTPAVG